jgi:hypothetical protein
MLLIPGLLLRRLAAAPGCDDRRPRLGRFFHSGWKRIGRGYRLRLSRLLGLDGRRRCAGRFWAGRYQRREKRLSGSRERRV